MKVAAVSEVCISAALTGGSPDTARVPGLIVKGDRCPLPNQGEGTGAMGRAEKSVPRSVIHSSTPSTPRVPGARS